jgi:Sec23/Sec24 trunk domain
MNMTRLCCSSNALLLEDGSLRVHAVRTATADHLQITFVRHNFQPTSPVCSTSVLFLAVFTRHDHARLVQYSVLHSLYNLRSQDLQVDAHQPVSDHRKARCTGTALQVAAGLVDMGIASGACTARLMLFVGGPCTEGAEVQIPLF